MTRIIRRLRRRSKRAGDVLVGALAVRLLTRPAAGQSGPLGRLRRLDDAHDRAAAAGKPHRPRQSRRRLPREISGRDRGHPARGLGQSRRMGAEFAHLDRLWDWDPAYPDRIDRIVITREIIDRFMQLANDGKPALDLCRASGQLGTAGDLRGDLQSRQRGALSPAQYPGIDRWLRETRTASMGELIPTGLDAPVKIADALKRGAHVGMLVDQYYVRGVDGHILRPPHQGQSADRAARPAFRLPDPRHPHRAPARPSLPRRADRGDRAGARRRGQDRYRRHHADHHQRGRRLDPRASRAMAVAAPPLAAGRR